MPVCALALGLVGCGRTENDNPFLIVRPDAETGGQASTTNVGAGADAGGAPFIPPTVIDGPITQVASSSGCGLPFLGQSGSKATIRTSGIKAPDCAAHLVDGKSVCGPWAAWRDYYVNLPASYDPSKAYPLIFEAPGCGGNGTDVYPLQGIADQAIRVGLSPGPSTLGHGTNPEQGCFDDKEGDDSIDWVFYEHVYDRLNAELCFDRNRVFVSGNSSGAWLSNELACKYAGDPLRPVRGVLANTGGLPTDPRYAPTCSQKPTAGMWVHEVNAATVPFASAQAAIDRAMLLAQCPVGQTYATAGFANFPIGGNNADDTCQRIRGCDELYPLVVCAIPFATQGGHDSIVNPGWSTFVKSFSSGSLLTQ